MGSFIVVTLILGRLALLNVYINFAILYTPQVLGNPLAQVQETFEVGQDYTVTLPDTSTAYYFYRDAWSKALKIAGNNAESCNLTPAGKFLYRKPSIGNPKTFDEYISRSGGNCTLFAQAQNAKAFDFDPKWFKLRFADIPIDVGVYCTFSESIDPTRDVMPLILGLGCKWRTSSGYCREDNNPSNVVREKVEFNLVCSVEES